MASNLSRRDFLKVVSLAAGGLALSGLKAKSRFFKSLHGEKPPNILIIVFDAMSARNLSLYGYPRNTTPNFERFAQRATVYHAHRSSGNFTVPGAASLLTGVYPWTHRAINIGGLIQRRIAVRNIFRLIGSEYQRLAFSQNLWPNYFFGQFQGDIETVLPPESFSTVAQIVGSHLKGDENAAYRAYDDFLLQDGVPPASLVSGLLARMVQRRAVARAESPEYPRGLPRTGNYPIYFKLNDMFAGLRSTLQQLPTPFFAYFHFWSPHAPYKPTSQFEQLFIKDEWRPEPKPDHRLGDQISRVNLNNRRRNYDEYIANIDAEFGNLLDAMEHDGLLDQSYVILTADHGESFERGVEGHITPLLYEPLIHVPMMISSPGQQARQDVYTSTSHVDMLPTLTHLSGREIPDWAEGQVLPALGGRDDSTRALFSMEAKANPAFAPLKKATVTMVKGQYKMIYYTGLESNDSFELYDLQNDSEELHDIYPELPVSAEPLREELLEELAKVNSNYKKD